MLLLPYLAKLVLERNYVRLEWWALDWNTPAFEFYRRLGAKPIDELTAHRVTDDALQALARNGNSH